MVKQSSFGLPGQYGRRVTRVNENLRIPEDTISVPKLARIFTCSLCSSVELEISGYFKMEDQLFSSQNSDLNNIWPCVLMIMIIK